MAPPLYPVSKNDRGAYALLIAVILITITGIAICIKLQITYSTFRKLRRDDHSLVAALVGTSAVLLQTSTDMPRSSPLDTHSAYAEPFTGVWDESRANQQAQRSST